MAFRPYKLGKFYLYEKLAIGGMAEIFKAKLFGVSGFEKTLVVKLILPEYANDEEFVKMFIDEANIAVSLNHSNIVPVYELGRIGERYYMAMEFVDGENVETIVETWQEKRGHDQPLPMWHCVYVAHEVCRGLEYAHTKADASGKSLNIVHRDVSPQNVMISFDGEVKLVDFGIAKAASKLSMTRVGTIKGKFEYMSPEQAYGDDVDGRSDVYSLGIVLWELVTGRPLFTGANEIELLRNVREGHIPPASSIVPTIPFEVEKVLNRALTPDVSQRYPSAAQFQAELEALLRSGKTADARTLGDFMRALYGRRRPKTSEPKIADPVPSAPAEERTVSFAISEVFHQETSSEIRLPPGPVPSQGSAELTTAARGTSRATGPSGATGDTVPRESRFDEATAPRGIPATAAAPALDDRPTADSITAQQFDLDEREKTIVSPVSRVQGTAKPQPGAAEDSGPHMSLSDLLEPGPPPASMDKTAEVGAVEEDTGDQELADFEQAILEAPEDTDTAAVVKRQSSMMWTVMAIIGGVALIGGAAVLLGVRPWERPVVTPPPTATLVVSTPTATPAPTPIPMRVLSVVSSPADASIRVDGKAVGKTPLTSMDITQEDELIVQVIKSGFEPWERTVEPGADDVNLIAKLKRKRVATPKPTPRRTARKTPVPTPKVLAGQGTLVLNADPWATVYIDGKRIQNTPILGLKLSAGKHKVRLVNSELNVTKDITVDIVAGQETRRIIDMKK